MTLFALALVLTAAFLHATWNFLAKRVAGQLAFVFLVCVVSSVIWAPFAVAILIVQRPEIGVSRRWRWDDEATSGHRVGAERRRHPALFPGDARAVKALRP